MTNNTLLSIIYADAPDLLEQVRTYIGDGAYLDLITDHGESALRVASNNGRFDVVALLLECGAAEYQLEWTTSIEQAVLGTLDSLRASVLQRQDLEFGDFWERTPLLMAILAGDIGKVALLLSMGANRDARGRCGKPAAAYAVQRDDVAMLTWLAEQGFDMEAIDQFQTTPLMLAAQLGKPQCMRFLIALGVDIHRKDQAGQSALQHATRIDIAGILINAGADPNDMNGEARTGILGIACDGYPSVSAADFCEGGYRTFGKANPDRIDAPFWLDMVRCGAIAWRARDKYDNKGESDPVWSYQRYGRTTTVLPDGRIIEIGGEHEDWYDIDFCIYNDVTVFDRQGGVDILSYPAEVFPPTDFHTATLADDAIYLIGRLGYAEARQPGTTPVFRLDLSTFRITEVPAIGACPGWIYRHQARLDGTDGIVVTGGMRQVDNRADAMENQDTYRLCLKTQTWSRL